MKENRILERNCAANEQYFRWECLQISGIPGSISIINLEQAVLKFFCETGVTTDSRYVEAYHSLSQPANPKKVIIKLSERKYVAMVIKIYETTKYWSAISL